MDILQSIFEDIEFDDDEVLQLEEAEQNLDIVEASMYLHDTSMNAIEVEVGIILSTHASDNFIMLSDERRSIVNSMYARFGEGCTVEELMTKVDQFNVKSKDLLKKMWAEFQVFVQRMMVNVKGTVNANIAHRARITGLGSALAWKDKKKIIPGLPAETKSWVDYSAIIQVTGGVLGQVAVAVLKGSWAISKDEVDAKLVKADDYWKQYKEEQRAEAEKEAAIHCDRENAGLYAKDIMARSIAVIKIMEYLKDFEGKLKSIKINNVRVEKGAVDPTTLVRRIIRLNSMAITRFAKDIKMYNTILSNIKKADGKE